MEVRGLGNINLGSMGAAEPNCPPGYYPKIYTAGTGGAVVQCAPRNEESLWCSWFGVGCQGPPLPTLPIPAPQTQEQMTVPGAWTPADAGTETAYWGWWRDHQAYMASNPGQAAAPLAAKSAVDTVTNVLKSPGLWLLVGAAAVVAIIIAAKRV